MSMSGIDAAQLEVLGSLVPARVIRHHINHQTPLSPDTSEVESKDDAETTTQSDEPSTEKEISKTHSLTMNSSRHSIRAISHASRGVSFAEDPKLVPFTEEYEAAVLFADISGFSALAERLVAELGCAANAAEKLSNSVGKSLEKMVATICNKGGDVIKFAGDAILAVFPAETYGNDLEQATLCCTQVAIALLSLDLVAGGDVKLSVHCGIGSGTVISYHVGGLQYRWEYVITGDPVEQMGKAEPEAQAGEVVMSKESYSIIADKCIGTVLESSNFRVESLVSTVEEFPAKTLIFSELQKVASDPSELKRMYSLMRCYVPRPVLVAIESGQSLWVAELRICSTLFCRLIGLKFESQSDLDVIQRAVNCVQNQIYAYEGTLCRFIVDDKGAGLLLAFGLPPFMHENDPVRATKSALDIHTHIKLLSDEEKGLNLSCSIGVTSGRVFCGTAGGRIRCEYTLHGTLVNLAARYMVAAKDGVLCGEQTYNESRHQVVFDPPLHIKVKGKEGLVAVYRPRSKRLMSLAFKSETPMVGREQEVKAIDVALEKLTSVTSVVESTSNKQILVFEGEAGLGKSRLCQYVVEKATEMNAMVLLGVGTDTEVNTPFFLWKSILAQLFRSQVDPDDHTAATIAISKMDTEAKIEVIKSIIRTTSQAIRKNTSTLLTNDSGPMDGGGLGDDDDSSAEEELYPLLGHMMPEIVKVDDNPTTEKMKGEARASAICNLLANVIIGTIYKKNALQEGGRSSSKAIKVLGDRKASLVTSKGSASSSLALLVEDLHWVDAKSMQVINMILESNSKLLLVVSARDVIHQGGANSQSNFDFYQSLCALPETTTIVLKPFGIEQVRKCMCMWLEVNKVPDKAADAVFKKSGGHPLFSEELCKLMRETNALIVDGDECKISKEAQDGNFGLPDTISALMTSRLDRVAPSQQLTLKVASVIGMVFLKHELSAVMLSRGDGAADPAEARRLLDADVDALVAQGLLIEDDGPVSHYRFKSAMLRESAYELLLFGMRKQLHYRLAEYYEERNKDYLEPWFLVLANNYYFAEEFDKAVYFLELAGNDALALHGMQQVWSCFTRLLNMSPDLTAHIPHVVKAGWSRKVGEALLFLGRPVSAEEHFHDALGYLELDACVIPQPRGFLCIKGKPKPRLVKDMASFHRYITEGNREAMLEAARCYELLGTLDRYHDSPVALERRLNAIHLAESLREQDTTTPPEVARSYAYAAEYFVGLPTQRDAELAELFAQKAVNEIESVDDSETQALVHRISGAYAAMTGRLKKAEIGIKKAVWVCRFLNFERMRTQCQELLIQVTLLSGNVQKAHSQAQSLVLIPGACGDTYCLAARLAVLSGRLQDAKRNLEKAAHMEDGTFNTYKLDETTLHEAPWNTLSDFPDGLIALAMIASRQSGSSPACVMRLVMMAADSLMGKEYGALPFEKFSHLVAVFHALVEVFRMVGSSDRPQTTDGASSMKHSSTHSVDTADVVHGGKSIHAFVVAGATNKSKVSPVKSALAVSRRSLVTALKKVLGLIKRYGDAYKPCKPEKLYCEIVFGMLVNKKVNSAMLNDCVHLAKVSGTSLIHGLALGLKGQQDLLNGVGEAKELLETSTLILKECGATYQLGAWL